VYFTRIIQKGSTPLLFPMLLYVFAICRSYTI